MTAQPLSRHGDEEVRQWPTEVAGWPPARDDSSGGPILAVAVAAGAYTSAALTGDGRLWTFGSGHHGALGHGDRRAAFAPRPVAGPLAGRRVVAISCGEVHTAAVCAAGALWSFGKGCLGHGVAADQRLVPTAVAALFGRAVVAVSCGGPDASGGTRGGGAPFLASRRLARVRFQSA